MADIRDFILGEETSVSTKTRAERTPATYEIVSVSGDAFVVRKKTKTTTTLMVVIPGKDQKYLKNEKNGSIEQLNAKNFASFCRDIPEDGLELVDDDENRCFWMKALLPGVTFSKTFFAIYEDGLKYEWLKSGIFRFPVLREIPYRYRSRGRMLNFLDPAERQNTTMLFEAFSKVYGADVSRDFFGYCAFASTGNARLDEFQDRLMNTILETYQSRRYSESVVEIIRSEYGIDKARDFCNRIAGSLNSPDGYYLKEIINNNTMDYDTLCAYLFETAIQEGFDGRLHAFVELWKDDLMSQAIVYGTVEDKYPKMLCSHHNIITAKARLVKYHVDEEKWQAAVERMKPKDEYGDPYSIFSPRTKDDLLEEARMQANCLASYIPKVVQGESMIYFLRKNEELNESFVTIEVREDGSLGQVKGRFNKDPEEDVMKYVQDWHNRKFGTSHISLSA